MYLKLIRSEKLNNSSTFKEVQRFFLYHLVDAQILPPFEPGPKRLTVATAGHHAKNEVHGPTTRQNQKTAMVGSPKSIANKYVVDDESNQVVFVGAILLSILLVMNAHVVFGWWIIIHPFTFAAPSQKATLERIWVHDLQNITKPWTKKMVFRSWPSKIRLKAGCLVKNHDAEPDKNHITVPKPTPMQKPTKHNKTKSDHPEKTKPNNNKNMKQTNKYERNYNVN